MSALRVGIGWGAAAALAFVVAMTGLEHIRELQQSVR